LEEELNKEKAKQATLAKQAIKAKAESDAYAEAGQEKAGTGGIEGTGGPPSLPAPASERRKQIPKHVKTLVWNKYIGEEAATAKCTCCRATQISVRAFQCGHVVAEALGGNLTINNLRPICAACNASMGTRSMNEFTAEFFGWTL
jgi:hypothetical protein